MTFAHSISSTSRSARPTIGEEVVRAQRGRHRRRQIVAPAQNQLGVDPAANDRRLRRRPMRRTSCATGAGLYEMRVYVGETLIGRGQFRLAEG